MLSNALITGGWVWPKQWKRFSLLSFCAHMLRWLNLDKQEQNMCRMPFVDLCLHAIGFGIPMNRHISHFPLSMCYYIWVCLSILCERTFGMSSCPCGSVWLRLVGRTNTALHIRWFCVHLCLHLVYWIWTMSNRGQLVRLFVRGRSFVVRFGANNEMDVSHFLSCMRVCRWFVLVKHWNKTNQFVRSFLRMCLYRSTFETYNEEGVHASLHVTEFKMNNKKVLSKQRHRRFE